MRSARRAVAWGVVLAGLGVVVHGCGAAYYGTAIAIFATQEDSNTIDQSFAEGAPTAPEIPALAELELSTAQIDVQRNTGGGFLTGTTGQQPTTVTDFEVTAIRFPAGFGEARSNRDVATNLVAGDRLVVRIDGDTAQELTFVAADAASIGSMVAATIQTKVRALTPQDTASVTSASYNGFTASFDPNTQSYTFKSGAPGERSAVVFEPTAVGGSGDAIPDAASTTTASRLGLGVAQGGIEISGAESIRFRVLNGGTDTIGAGTQVSLYLSHDKVLDTSQDILFDVVSLPETVAVGEARLVTRRNGNALPQRLVRSDFTTGRWYVLFDLAVGGGETVIDNNLTNSLTTLEIVQPVDDPATTATETANALDFVPTKGLAPIAVVSSRTFNGAVTITNQTGIVPGGGVPIDIDLVLSSDQSFSDPAYLRDPAGTLAGVRINPTNPNQQVSITINTSGTDPLTAVATGTSLITVQFNGAAGITPVNSLVTALNSINSVDAFTDGNGTASSDSLQALLTAAGNPTQVITRDIFVARRSVTFPSTTQPQVSQSFSLSGSIRNSIQTQLLPAKLHPFYRITPRGTTFSTTAENTKNNVRQASNFVRVYNQSTAFFDPNTGAVLPTKADTDFLRLDAVISRPVNAGSIAQGQQRVFAFELPDTGLTIDESQLLVVLDTTNFDAHMDLLNGQGEFVTGSDDTALGTSPLIYTPAVGASGNRTFYLVVSAARVDESDLSGGGETFNLTISVNSREAADPGLVAASPSLNLTSSRNKRYEVPNGARVENLALIPFSLTNTKAEVMFVLPARARVRIASTPVFTVGVSTTITSFVAGGTPSPVEFQAQLDATSTRIVYRPSGGNIDTSHIFEAGVYTVAFTGTSGDTQKFRLEVDAEFITLGQQ